MATTDDLELIWNKRREFRGADHPGLRLNNLTTTQRDALTGSGAAKAGDAIFNTTTSRTEVYDGTRWITTAGPLSSPRCIHTGGNAATAGADGTNLTVVVTELYVAEVFVPANVLLTGVAPFWGSATEGNAKVMLFNSSGTRLAISASTDVSGHTADSYTRVAFISPYFAIGPAIYYVGIIADNTGHRINTHVVGNFGAGKIESLVYATEAGYASITVPTTFTTGLGPIATLY